VKRLARFGAPLAASALLAAGCASPLPAPVPAVVLESQGLYKDAEVAWVTRDVEFRIVNHFVFWVPTRTLGPTLSEAVAEALDRGNGQVLTKATIERVAWWVPFLYGEYGWVVRGDVVRLRKPLPPPELP
jgi:hypothetical protein